MRYWLTVAAIWVCGFAALGKPPESPVRLRIGVIASPTVHAGDSVVVKIPIVVSPGYHVNANPAASDDYIPLEVSFDTTTTGLRAGKVIYPSGKKWRLEGTAGDLLVYGGDIEVQVPLVIERGTGPGEHVLKGTVDFQACDNHVCFLPESRPLTVTIKVSEETNSR